jgi:hypothetical protein
MEDMLIHDNFIISKNENSYKIEFKYNSFELIGSIIKSKIIRGITTDENYRMLKFKATSVLSFKEYQLEMKKITGQKKMSIYNVANIVNCLSRQLKYIIMTNHTFLGYEIENLLVIDYDKFIYLNNDILTKLYDNNALVSFPFVKQNIFLSPELLKTTIIPSYINFKTIYFSLACLIIYALSDDNEFYLEYLNNNGDTSYIINYLNSLHIRHTKLYWLLYRCIIKDPENRSIIFI